MSIFNLLFAAIFAWCCGASTMLAMADETNRKFYSFLTGIMLVQSICAIVRGIGG